MAELLLDEADLHRAQVPATELGRHVHRVQARAPWPWRRFRPRAPVRACLRARPLLRAETARCERTHAPCRAAAASSRRGRSRTSTGLRAGGNTAAPPGRFATIAESSQSPRGRPQRRGRRAPRTALGPPSRPASFGYESTGRAASQASPSRRPASRMSAFSMSRIPAFGRARIAYGNRIARAAQTEPSPRQVRSTGNEPERGARKAEASVGPDGCVALPDPEREARPARQATMHGRGCHVPFDRVRMGVE